MRCLLLSLLVAGALAANTVPAAQSPTAQTAPSEKPGIDIAGMDASVKPGDDFDAYANGRWHKTTEIPADRSSVSVFYLIFKKAEERTADLIRQAGAGKPAPGSDARRMADYYAAFMDEAGIEARGLTPVRPELAAIEAISTRADLSRVLGQGLRADTDPVNSTNFQTDHLFGLFVAQDLNDPSRNVAYLMQGGLGMPSRDYYLSPDKAMVEFRGKYRAYIADLFKLAKVADADRKAQAVYALEMKIAAAQESLVNSEDVHKANNPWPRAAFPGKAPGLDWTAYFKAAGLDRQKTIDAWQADAIVKLSALVASEPLQAWKDYLAFHAIDDDAPLLSKAYADLQFGFYGHTLNGTPTQRDRWKRGVSLTNADLADAVGKSYVEHFFPASSKTQIQRMVDNLRAAFDERIDTLAWMTPATRAKAKAKVATLRVGVGYPETWRDYSKLEIRRDDPVGNHHRAQLFEYRHQLAKLAAPVDKGEWWMSPQTVNAVNLPLQNALNFPAAILEPPFFDPAADAASNYGAIGAIIGHEISHSFDNTGAEFDADGRLANWWTDEDQAHFKTATHALAIQYDGYEVLPGVHINGQQTLGENIADLSGLAIAYLAYRKSLDGKTDRVVDGFTGDQRFFIAYAQSRRNNTRDAALRGQIATDGHAPSRYRAQTVRNLDAWYDAFASEPGDKLYLDPDRRVKIW